MLEIWRIQRCYVKLHQRNFHITLLMETREFKDGEFEVTWKAPDGRGEPTSHFILSLRVYLTDNRVPDIFFDIRQLVTWPNTETERNYFHQGLQWHSISDLVIDLTLRNKTFKFNLFGWFFNWKQISMSVFDFWVESTRLSLIGVSESFWVRIL